MASLNFGEGGRQKTRKDIPAIFSSLAILQVALKIILAKNGSWPPWVKNSWASVTPGSFLRLFRVGSSSSSSSSSLEKPTPTTICTSIASLYLKARTNSRGREEGRKEKIQGKKDKKRLLDQLSPFFHLRQKFEANFSRFCVVSFLRLPKIKGGERWFSQKFFRALPRTHSKIEEYKKREQSIIVTQHQKRKISPRLQKN